MRTAHIVTREHEVGDRVLALCGKEHKVKQLWEDIPAESPICRDCVDFAVVTLDQADDVIQMARRYWRRIDFTVEAMGAVLNPEDLALDLISDAADLFEREQATKKQDKEDQRKAKQTCICVWTDANTRLGVVDCPIHHGELPPVAPEE